MLVAIQLSVLGMYRPPVLEELLPPQTIISLPVQTAVCPYRGDGSFTVVVAVQVLFVHPASSETEGRR